MTYIATEFPQTLDLIHMTPSEPEYVTDSDAVYCASQEVTGDQVGNDRRTLTHSPSRATHRRLSMLGLMAMHGSVNKNFLSAELPDEPGITASGTAGVATGEYSIPPEPKWPVVAKRAPSKDLKTRRKLLAKKLRSR